MDSTEAAAEIDAPFIKEAPQSQGDGGLVAIKGALMGGNPRHLGLGEHPCGH